MTNLEVDVMEGDEFAAHVGRMGVQQKRGDKTRDLRFRKVDEWGDAPLVYTHALKMEDVEAYCKVCGLTVKQVKPEPKVETIKPPEWAIRWEDGRRELFDNQPSAIDALVQSRRAGHVVRIDWGAK